MKIRTKLGIFPIILAIILVVSLFITLIVSHSTVRNQVGDHLLTTAQSRAEHIKTLLHNYKETVQVLAAGIPFTNVLDLTIDYAERMTECDLRIKRTIEIDPYISRIRILNKNGIVISSSHKDVGFDISEESIFIKGKDGVHVGEIHRSKYTGNLVLNISVPIFVRDKFTGVLIVNIDVENQLYEITTDKTGLGKTGEIYLIDKEGYIITPSRFIDDAILKIKINTEQVNQYFSEHIEKGLPEFMEEEPFAYLDYRDNKVLGTHYFIPELQWGLIAEIDLEEANKPIYKLTFWLIAVFSFLIIITIIFDIIIYRDIALPIKELHEGTEEIINGNFDHKVNIETKNEIGQLSRAFDIMTNRITESQKELKEHAEKLDIRVKERTAELEKQYEKSEKQRIANLVIMNDLNRITKNLKSEITERKKTEKELIGSEERYRSLVTNLPVGIFRSTLQGKVIFANTAMVEIYGYESVEELLRIPAEDYYTLRDGRDKMLKKLEKKGYLLEYETQEKRKDNTQIRISTNYKKVWSEDDGIYYIDGVVAEITELKQAENKIRVERDKLKLLMDGLSQTKIGVDVVGLDYKVISQNRILKDRFGDSTGKICYKEYMGFDKPCSFCPMIEAIKNNVVKKVELKANDGRDYEILSAPLMDVDGTVDKVIEVVNDITERRRAEKIQKTLFNISSALNTTDSMHELLSKIREYLGSVIDTTNLYVALYDEKADMISLPFDVDEKDDYETFPAGKTLTKYVIKTGKSLFATNELVESLTKKGIVENIGTPSKIWLGVPLKIENKVIGVIAVQSYDDPDLFTEKDLEILTFVSEEVALAIKHIQADEQIRRELKEKVILLREVHHRVKNNLQVISGLLQLQQNEITTKEDALKGFASSQDRILAMAKAYELLLGSEYISEVSVGKYITSLAEQLKYNYDNHHKVNITYSLDELTISIEILDRLGLILNELITNAIKYAFEGRDSGNIHIELKNAEDHMEIKISDNGIGIPRKFNIHESKTLGLSIVDMLTQQLRGTMKLDRKNGTSFTLVIPKELNN